MPDIIRFCRISLDFVGFYIKPDPDIQPDSRFCQISKKKLNLALDIQLVGYLAQPYRWHNTFTWLLLKCLIDRKIRSSATKKWSSATKKYQVPHKKDQVLQKKIKCYIKIIRCYKKRSIAMKKGLDCYQKNIKCYKNWIWRTYLKMATIFLPYMFMQNDHHHWNRGQNLHKISATCLKVELPP